ncbi:Retrovirus-related Pol polyprotein from type-2 retrotransposable element R2DM; Endonuclease [Eumeta japonica]|uniref:Retrovirus-related Pol polyprotein from type-2 retrotransposable element R2DM Endonuclease n=1 Tax=Eumeta variegata TaxID=151549 RepID=A0A4C1URV6_EUMVA|nr:Retrovirus-related Pol polyprotein from type-2 retrotransposable element R2DM; Endonuclease [Eumeta japonica]
MWPGVGAGARGPSVIGSKDKSRFARRGGRMSLNRISPAAPRATKYYRISTTLDENQPTEQAGFRKNFATIDHIHTVKQIVEKYNEYNKPLYMAFIDYTKAFDRISHEEIWDSLKNQGIPTVYIKIIKSIYAKSKARIKLESLGETFKIERRVRQGDPLSPKLFSAVLENVFRKLHWNYYGLDIDGRKLNHLRLVPKRRKKEKRMATQKMRRRAETNSRTQLEKGR